MWQGARSNLALAIAQWDGLENDVSKAAYCYINYAFLYQATFNTRGNHNGTKLILLFKYFFPGKWHFRIFFVNSTGNLFFSTIALDEWFGNLPFISQTKTHYCSCQTRAIVVKPAFTLVVMWVLCRLSSQAIYHSNESVTNFKYCVWFQPLDCAGVFCKNTARMVYTRTFSVCALQLNSQLWSREEIIPHRSSHDISERV